VFTLKKDKEPLARTESSRMIAYHERIVIFLALAGAQSASDLVVRFFNARAAPSTMVLTEQFGFDAREGTMEPSRTG